MRPGKWLLFGFVVVAIGIGEMPSYLWMRHRWTHDWGGDTPRAFASGDHTFSIITSWAVWPALCLIAYAMIYFLIFVRDASPYSEFQRQARLRSATGYSDREPRRLGGHFNADRPYRRD